MGLDGCLFNICFLWLVILCVSGFGFCRWISKDLIYSIRVAFICVTFFRRSGEVIERGFRVLGRSCSSFRGFRLRFIVIFGI